MSLSDANQNSKIMNPINQPYLYDANCQVIFSGMLWR